ncbi:amidohydrolase [Rhizobium sp. KVB221]|uniref:Amidohydrolase n=1 Tax=Rhizobium setariae TaxID=2801340 RepID=A0A936YKR6_9HYPH|nr:amidohydrolase [Rhizobium setariae]MBL0372209.1 amidohydrolase [Rhizobium setariae]
MPTPDLILFNANIVTMDPLTPKAQALAVKNGRVIALGADKEIRALASENTRIVDAGGRLVLPGFQDTHIHLQDSGRDYAQNAGLDAARTIDELVATMKTFSESHDGTWVNGVGWYTGIFHDGNLTRQVLDLAVPDRPSFILASDGHNACLNSRACELLGLVSGIDDPFNGHFVRDENGVPTGMLHEDAIKWAEAKMPQPTDEDFVFGIKFAQSLANRHGITGVLDASVRERHARVYSGMQERGELTVRVCATARVEPYEKTVDAVARLQALRAANQSEMFTIHSAKFFLDGVMENRTAAMIEDYSDAAGGNAPLMFSHPQILELFTAFDAARFQIHVHVIGDYAVRAALDGLEKARSVNGRWPSLHQLAHIQCIDPSDIPRLAELGAVANVQALWARHEPSVTDIALPIVGEVRGKWMYAFRSLIDAGAPYALSSDWGVSTLNPFEIIETAITRQPPGRPNTHPVFLPEQRMTREECIKAYTIHAAAAAWRSADTGSLSLGKYADLIVLDRDILTCDVYDIGDTNVLLTLLGGRQVHRDVGFAG